MNSDNYTFGKSIGSWHADRAQTVTFVVTDDCNLRCKYCYITHKKSDNKMDFDTAKAFIDRLLTTDEMRYSEAVILEFIGGEPLIEANLIDRIADYFKLRAFELDHDWYWNYRISICTNGVNYSSLEVQRLIKKNLNKMSITISVDGTKEKHDMQRIFPDGSGSFDKINDNIDLWLRQFRGATKVTFASDDLPLLYDSVLSLWNRGIKEVNANVVFENVWKKGDDKVLEEQLKNLADYVIDNKLYDKGYHCSFFDETIGYPYDEEDMDKTYCGAGKMIALSPNGNIYPCIRYYGYSLNNHEEWSVGDIKNGIDMEKVRPFVLSTNRIQSDSECLNCDIATGCGFCQGFNYDEAPVPTNFYRAKYICNMHKARVRANNYFFSKLYNVHGIERENNKINKKSFYFLLSDDYITYCCHENQNQNDNEMSDSVILEGLNYAQENFMMPIFVHGKSGKTLRTKEEYIGYDILHIVPIKYYNLAQKQEFRRILPVYDMENVWNEKIFIDNIILNVREDEIKKLNEAIDELIKFSNRININITELDRHFNEEEYRQQMEMISDKIIKIWENEGRFKEINILTDILFLDKHDNCQAGENTFVLSPLGKIYTCCADFSNIEDGFIGEVTEGIIKEYGSYLYGIENNNLCRICDAYQCRDCVYINKKNTKEYNVSPSFQCRKSHIERVVSLDLKSKFKNCSIIPSKNTLEIKENDYLDPISKFFKNNSEFAGYYKYQV
ncbi:radical SAM peptide maturase, CXXX-repeat target family [Tissierella carlieri]|uniref:radical SAM peptide maturase, CXXX-repeat target family n=1 Tax=Tissierella TaxID=41273 RepID=UPI001C126399|nr:radical SAM peptide maturase, CXXX-repeat target family [Tissierella carlieri]MBU5310491.1 radical SAM peptide maturase, CXXX-repeat target family [Tissierella carlieri]